MRVLLVGAAALALVACSAPPLPTGSHSGQPCADKVAQAYASSANSTPGIWSCMSAQYQQTLSGNGTTGDGFLGGATPYNSEQYVGGDDSLSVYELHVNPADSQVVQMRQMGVNVPDFVTLTVWTHNGRVTGFSVAVPQ